MKNLVTQITLGDISPLLFFFAFYSGGIMKERYFYEKGKFKKILL